MPKIRLSSEKGNVGQAMMLNKRLSIETGHIGEILMLT